jgi:hypothetical protein
LALRISIALFGGIVGALLVFALSQLALIVKDRHEFQSAVLAVLDEVGGNLTAVRTAAGFGTASGPLGETPIADVLSTAQFEDANLVLSRRLPDNLRRNLFRTYQYQLDPAFRYGIGDANAKGGLAELTKALEGVQKELDSYSTNLAKARVRRTRSVTYDAEMVDFPTAATGIPRDSPGGAR